MTEGRLVLSAYRQNTGVSAHCRRVATLSRELAGALKLPESEQNLLEQVALSHHVAPILLDDGSRQRLLSDVKIGECGDVSMLPDDVRDLLLILSGRAEAADAATAKLLALIEISDDFDQFFETEPMGKTDAANTAVEAMLSYLQVTSRADVSRVIDRLPVFPCAAREAVRHASNPEVSVRELESVALLDPVLSGLLIQTANSAFYSPREPFSSIQPAIAYIGVEVTRKILLAAAFRGNFASLPMHRLWNHCLDVAHAAEQLAHRSQLKINPSEAFLAGLVHDVGRLAFSIMPAPFLERFDRLIAGGCPPILVETCLSGLCHGEVGAETLAAWKFPEPIQDAVRWHHRPERSPQLLASLLFLAEFVTGSEEDLPSHLRLSTACRQAGLDLAVFSEVDGQDTGYLRNLRFAA